MLLPTPEAGAELLGHDLPLEVGLLVVIKHVVVLTPGQKHVVLGDDSCVGPLVDLLNKQTIDEFFLLFHNWSSNF